MKLFSVMVTGANRGIGLEFVRHLSQLRPPPTYIFATYRDKNTVEELNKIQDTVKETTNIYLIKMDIANNSEIDNAAKIVEDVVKEDGLTLLINNAGVVNLEPFPTITKEVLENNFAINAAGPLLLMQAVYPLLKRSCTKINSQGMSFSKAGVLNMTSMAGSITNTGVSFTQDLIAPSYKISKAALNMGMRIFATETKKDDVLVIMMCPGWVRTRMGTKHALIEPKESIEAMMETLSKLDETHHGMYMDRHGNPYPF